MKIVLCIVLFLLPGFCMLAQTINGFSSLPDTSYNLKSEYQKHVKLFPFIKPVMRSYPRRVQVDSNIRYLMSGGKAQLLDVFYPTFNNKKPRVAIIIIHGGGWRSGTRMLHHPLAEKLATLGYVCITPSYRLSTNALFPAAIQDAKASIRWVRTHAASYNIDTTAVVIAGHSAGGQLAALAGATHTKNIFQEEDSLNVVPHINAVIDMDGILAFLHPESGEGDDSKRTSAATYWFGYPKNVRPDLWSQASALTHAGPDFPPILFLNSMVDRMHAGQTDLIRILDQHRIHSRVRVYKGAPHSWLLFHPWFDSTVTDIDQFLNERFAKSPKQPTNKL